MEGRIFYVINYIAGEIPKVTKKIFEAFGIQQETALSDEMGENVWKLTGIVADNAKKLAKTIINPDSTKKDNDAGKTETKKEEKK